MVQACLEVILSVHDPRQNNNAINLEPQKIKETERFLRVYSSNPQENQLCQKSSMYFAKGAFVCLLIFEVWKKLISLIVSFQ